MDLLLEIPMWSGNGAVTWSVEIPLDTRLLGLTFYNQAWFVDQNANALGVVTTQGGHGVLGL